MTDDDVLHAALGQHPGGHLAGVGAVVGKVDVLGADADIGSGGSRLRRRNGDIGRAEDDIAGILAGDHGLDFIDESGRFGGGEVHFPVAGDHGSSFAVHNDSTFFYCVPGVSVCSAD